MKVVAFSWCLVVLGSTIILAAPIGQGRPPFRRGPETDDEVKTYLSRFGHWRPRLRNRGNGAAAADDLKNSIREFQKSFGLDVTGQVNNETLNLMATPRCGMPDNNSTFARRKRFVLYNIKWSRPALTYYFQNYTARLPVDVIRNAIERALKYWSDVTPLTFTEVRTAVANIKLLFARRAHGDNNDFDGPGGVLAHAYYPRVGDAHFDDDERWSNDSNGINLLQVAVHEFGHSLGLQHSAITGAVMFPYYYYRSNFSLANDDIQGIQALYGLPLASSSSTSGTSSFSTSSSTSRGSTSSTTSRTTTTTTRQSTSTTRSSTSTSTPSSTARGRIPFCPRYRRWFGWC